MRRLTYHGREGGHYKELGYNSRVSSVTAAMLCVKISKHCEWTKRRRQIADYYTSVLERTPVDQPKWGAGVYNVWHTFTLHAANRDELAAWLGASGIPTRIHYRLPLHREQLFKLSCGEDVDYPNACMHADRTLSLPIHAYLTDSEVEHIARSVSRYFA